jgi:hypothetical protein
MNSHQLLVLWVPQINQVFISETGGGRKNEREEGSDEENFYEILTSYNLLTS